MGGYTVFFTGDDEFAGEWSVPKIREPQYVSPTSDRNWVPSENVDIPWSALVLVFICIVCKQLLCNVYAQRIAFVHSKKGSNFQCNLTVKFPIPGPTHWPKIRFLFCIENLSICHDYGSIKQGYFFLKQSIMVIKQALLTKFWRHMAEFAPPLIWLGLRADIESVYGPGRNLCMVTNQEVF